MAGKGRQHGNGRKKHRVVIVDDHPILRQGLAEIIEHEEDLEVCGQAEDAAEAMEAAASLEPDMLIVDISLKGSSGIELIKQIKAQYPAMPVLTLSAHAESLYAERALLAGARGYITKHEATDEVIKAIHRVLDGQIYLSSGIAETVVSRLAAAGSARGGSPIESLSEREQEVFGLIGQGHGTRQIADKLGLSVKTIETYRANIKEKLNLEDAHALTNYAIQWVSSEKHG